MKLPGGATAIVKLEKLTHYCLSPTHPRGKHKARVFAAVLGLTAKNCGLLRSALLAAAASAEARLASSDSFGARYIVDFSLTGPLGKGGVRSIWIVKHGEDVPRLTSCYVNL